MALVNMAVSLAKERLDKFLKDSDCCKCKSCYVDMLAFALNQMKPLYVNTKQGALMQRAMQEKMQNIVALDVAVARAIEVVGSNPHHPANEESEAHMVPVAGYDDTSLEILEYTGE